MMPLVSPGPARVGAGRATPEGCAASSDRELRRKREFAHDADTMPERAVADPTGDVDERDRIVALLRRLPTKQRAALVLRHYEGLPDAEIARLLGSSEVSVRTNAHRGMATLRRLLAEAAGESGEPTDGREVRRP